MGLQRYANGFEVTLHEDALETPFQWRKPRVAFVNSMSDLFHENVPLAFIQRVFATMEKCPQHTFQILTKRSQRARQLSASLPWPPNVWMGVSVEDSRVLFRIGDVQHVPAAVRFLSCEPLIGDLENLPLDGIHWVIVGGESGPQARRWERARGATDDRKPVDYPPTPGSLREHILGAVRSTPNEIYLQQATAPAGTLWA